MLIKMEGLFDETAHTSMPLKGSVLIIFGDLADFCVNTPPRNPSLDFNQIFTQFNLWLSEAMTDEGSHRLETMRCNKKKRLLQ